MIEEHEENKENAALFWLFEQLSLQNVNTFLLLIKKPNRTEKDPKMFWIQWEKM